MHNLHVLNKYKEAAGECRRLLHEHEAAAERRVIDSNNVGSFYRHVNKRMSCRSGVGVLHSPDGADAVSDSEKAEVLNSYFASVCTNDNGILPQFNKRVSEDVELSDIEFTPTLVTRAIKKLKSNLSCGPDGFPPVMFKKLARQLATPLSQLFSSFMSVGQIPADWRCAIVTPIAKGGAASDPSNYRPISLTNVTCKLMERVIVCKMLDYFLRNKVISKQQHGFLSGKSTTTNLLEQLNDWTVALDNKNSVTVGYIDYAKAFDSVSHQKLCHKLQAYGISGNLLNWIQEFLSGRSQCVRVGNALSSTKTLTSGVVQGSCLGPLLFIIYINDIVSLVDNQCTCKLYADDMKLYTVVRTTDFQPHFQECLDVIVKWSDAWQLNISYKKCAVMNITSTNSNPVTGVFYHIKSNPVPTVETIKDLGVTIENNLKFSSHVNNIVVRASARASLIHKCFMSKEVSLLSRAFVVYVRPLLEYASCVWSPHLTKDIERLERVQRRFTKRLSGLSMLTYKDRLRALGLQSLEARRLQFDLVHTYKILTGKIDVSIETFFTVQSYQSTRGHSYKLYLPGCRTDIRKFFFAQRVIRPWNYLELTPESMSSLHRFKAFIRTVDLSQFLSYS